MRKFRLIILTTLAFLTLFSVNSFATKAKKSNVEQVSALVITDTKEVEFDEPEIDEIVDAKKEHGSPILDEKIEVDTTIEKVEKIENIEKKEEIGPGIERKTTKKEENIQSLNLSNERQKLLEYAMRFLGSKYKFGCNSPKTGFDCSGFTQYIYKQSLNKNLLRNSASQYTQGKEVKSENMQIGDLLFYGNGKRINHVALYIGDGKVIHSSNERTGVKISPWNYRTPVGIKNIID